MNRIAAAALATGIAVTALTGCTSTDTTEPTRQPAIDPTAPLDSAAPGLTRSPDDAGFTLRTGTWKAEVLTSGDPLFAAGDQVTIANPLCRLFIAGPDTTREIDVTTPDASSRGLAQLNQVKIGMLPAFPDGGGPAVTITYRINGTTYTVDAKITSTPDSGSPALTELGKLNEMLDVACLETPGTYDRLPVIP